MGKIIRNGIKYSGTTNSADKINYNNTLSGLEAETAQEAFDELNTKIKNGGSNIKYLTKAQYEALPASKLTDDVEYRITDAHTTNRIDATDVTYGDGTVADAISEVTKNLGSLLIVSHVYKIETKTYSKGAFVVYFDLPKVDGYKPLFYVANHHSWYPNQIIPELNGYRIEDPTAEQLPIRYFCLDDTIEVTGGNFNAMVVYIRE